MTNWQASAVRCSSFAEKNRICELPASISLESCLSRKSIFCPDARTRFCGRRLQRCVNSSSRGYATPRMAFVAAVDKECECEGVVLARFLFVVPPLEGHVNPTVSVGRQLVARGHSVAWTGHPTIVRPLLPESSTLIPLDEHVGEHALAEKLRRAQTRGLERLKFLYEDFLLPLARSMTRGVDA